jgi:hypothetical protein
MLTVTYVALAALGCGYVVVSLLLGHLTDAGAHVPHVDAGVGHLGAHLGHALPGAHGAHAAGDYGAGGHGDVHASDSGATSFRFPFFSPLALATIFGCVGCYGLLARHGLGLGDLASLAVAIPAAIGTAWGVAWLSFRLVASSRGTSAIRLWEIEGAEGEVLTPIPEGGLGEVALLVSGQRYTTAARHEKGGAVPRGTAVRVVQMAGSTAVVVSRS